MASITQTIPQYNGGISQQADEKKLPGQLIEAKNVLPDITRGLLKRPGGKLIASLSDSTNNSETNGRWFHYYRDETEQYIGQVSRTGDVNIWRCRDGQEMHVENDTSTSASLVSYLTHTNDEDIQTLTLNDYTYVTNRTKTTALLDNASTINPVRPPEAYIELKKIAYASQYSVDLYDNDDFTETTTATRVKVKLKKHSGNCCSNSDGSYPTSGVEPGDGGWETRCDDDAGELRDGLCPNVDTQIFNINYGDSGDASEANVKHKDFAWTYSGSGDTDRKNLYIRITTSGQPVATEAASSGDIYRCRYTTTWDLLHGGTGWKEGDYVDLWMKGARYRVTIESHTTSKVKSNLALIRPEPTPFDTKTAVTSESILGSIRTSILGDSYGGTNTLYEFKDVEADGYYCRQIGNGIYVSRPTAEGSFNVSTPSGSLLNVLGTTVANVGDLPIQCKHGYVVKVANSIADEDDYYVKFFGDKDKDGVGVWEECAEPGRKVALDPATMPIQIVRNDSVTADATGTTHADGWFKVEQITWENCLVGNELTVPNPSFIGKTINKMLFFRNRLVILSDENVNMSQPGKFFNFWPKSAITFTATDNIDVSCSSEYPAIVYDGIQVNSGLVLFTKTQQFMLTTDSDVLSPQTVKINALASYNFNNTANPISLGTTIAFLDNAGQYSRFWEMAKVLREGEPDVIDQTKIVSQLFDKEVNKISNSRENGIVLFSKKDTSTLYGFRYFNSSNERLHQAWFTWEIVGTIQHHAILDDSLYIVVRNNGKDTLQKFSVKIHTDSITVTDDKNNADATDDEIYRLHLDSASAVTIPSSAYNESTNKTTFLKPDGYENTTAQICLYDNNTTSDYVGKYSTASIVNSNIEVSGDWSNRTVVLGYLFDMQVKFPTIYYTQTDDNHVKADTNASLIVHRIKLNFGANGSYSTTIDRLGKPNYTEIWEAPISDQYLLSNIAIDDEITKTIPIYERNKNLNITLKSTHPSPATLYSMTWEGDYTSKFYNRA